METRDGLHGRPCFGGRTCSGIYGDFSWGAASAWRAYTPCGTRCFWVLGQPVGFRMGQWLDLGAAGSRPGLPFHSHRERREDLGSGFVSSAHAAKLSDLVIEAKCASL